MHCGEKNHKNRYAATFFIMAILVWVLPAAADITTSGSIDPNYDATDPWIVDGILTLGVSANADLVVSAGSQIVSDGGAVAPGAASNASVAVMGGSSLWDNTSELRIGYRGDASLTISAGGQVTSGDAWIEAQEGGTALATVTGAGSRWTTDRTLTVGDYFHDAADPEGYGTIVASDGGVVEANDISVWEGSILAGDGTFAATQISNHGILRPGHSIGTLTFDGDLTMEPNSVLEIEIDNEDNSDKLIVTGQFDPGFGNFKTIGTETITGSHQYTVVEANSVSWPIIAVVDTYNTALLQSSIGPASGAEPNIVALRVTALAFDDANVVSAGNQQALGSALNTVAAGGGDTITTMLQQIVSGDELRTAYDQLSGWTRAPLGAASVGAGTRSMNVVSGRMRGVSGSRSSLEIPADAGAISDHATSRYSFALGNGTPYLSDQQWGIWGKFYGLYGDRETDGTDLGYHYSAYGAGFGLDYQVSERWLLGATGGYWDGNLEFASSADRTAMTGAHVGLYGSFNDPGWYVDSVVSYTSLDFESTRFVDLVDEQLEGDFGGGMFSGYVEAGLNWQRRPDCLIQPLASLQVATVDIDGYTESGGTTGLQYDSERYTSTQTGLGAKATRRLFRDADGSTAEIELRARWLHEFGDTQSSVGVQFTGQPGAAFRVEDAAIGRDSAVLGAGLSARLGQATRLYFDYDTELNPDRTTQIFSAALEYRW